MKRTPFFVLGLFLIAACSKTAATHKTQISLSVSEENLALLPHLQKEMVGESVAQALKKLDVAAQKWCVSPSKSTGLLRDLNAAETQAFKQNDLSLRGALGCSAWVKMTDRSPEVDFAYTRNAIDTRLKEPTHCVSVGFLQPYIMAAHFNCTSLTVVDFSFRTQRLHAELLPLLLGKNFPGIEATLEAWEKNTKTSLAEICADYSLSRCKIALMAFVEKYRTGLNVELVLSSLASYKPTGNTTTVIYSSNALDPNFTIESFHNILSKTENSVGLYTCHLSIPTKNPINLTNCFKLTSIT